MGLIDSEFINLPKIKEYTLTYDIQYDRSKDSFYSFTLGSYPFTQYVNGAYIAYKHFKKISPH